MMNGMDYLEDLAEAAGKNVDDKYEFLLNMYEILFHDLKAPVSIIYAITQLIELDSAPGSKALELTKKLRKNCDIIFSMITSAITGTRMINGDISRGCFYGDIVEFFKKTIESSLSLTVGRRTVISLVPNMEKRFVVFIPDVVERILLNLLINAVKFSGESSEVEVEMSFLNGWVEARITDDGPGVPEGRLERIFERYISDGSDDITAGLGLASVRILVGFLGGSVFAKNRDDGKSGLCVVFGFPAADGRESFGN